MIEKKVITETKTRTIKPARYDRDGVLLDPVREDIEFEKRIYAVKDGNEEHHFSSEDDAKRFLEGKAAWQRKFK
jgi:hypothetical protein